MSKKLNIYAMYRGDEFLVAGTVKECAEYLGVSENTVRWYTSLAARKRSPDNTRLIAIKVDEED